MLALLLMGHAYMIILVFLCQTLVYREVTALFSIKKKGDKAEPSQEDPWSKTLNWYFFAVANYFLYGESIIYYFKVFCQVYNLAQSLTSSSISMLYFRMLN
jgi:phosphatidate cytidylyltransferase